MKVRFVVGGHAHDAVIARSEVLSTAIASVLAKTGNVGQPAQEWELRTAAGDLLDRWKKPAEAAISPPWSSRPRPRSLRRPRLSVPRRLDRHPLRRHGHGGHGRPAPRVHHRAPRRVRPARRPRLRLPPRGRDGQQDGGSLASTDPRSFRALEANGGLSYRVSDNLDLAALVGATFSIEGATGAPVDPRLYTAAAWPRSRSTPGAGTPAPAAAGTGPWAGTPRSSRRRSPSGTSARSPSSTTRCRSRRPPGAGPGC
jgi:hypothetical protein